MLVNGYRRVNDYGSDSYTIGLPDGSTVNRTAGLSKHTGNAVHDVVVLVVETGHGRLSRPS